MLPRLLASSASEAQEQTEVDSVDWATDSEAELEGELGEGRIEDCDADHVSLLIVVAALTVPQGCETGLRPA